MTLPPATILNQNGIHFVDFKTNNFQLPFLNSAANHKNNCVLAVQKNQFSINPSDFKD
jgi:hypothetical protein